ncbi:MAG TPA: hypothetical protein VKD66_15190 [Streptosporangiaceae bacterium]|nr:hypothetical protein [Streptosporangiaceae bacterium]
MSALARLARLEQQVAEITATVEALAESAPPPPPQDPPENDRPADVIELRPRQAR